MNPLAALCAVLLFTAPHHHGRASVRKHSHHRRHSHHVSRRLPRFEDGRNNVVFRNFVSGRARYFAVIANLKAHKVHASTVLSHGLRSISSLIYGRHPSAAITGTFFAPSGGAPVGDVLVDGSLKARGYRGSALAVDWNDDIHIFDTRFGKKVDWSGYRFALRGAVRLVHAGKPHADPKSQFFHDPRIWGRAPRTGAGITKGGKLVLMATRNDVTLTEFARAMIKRGVREAVNLDGGSSTCLYYRGYVVIRPARRLSNMFLVREG